MPMSSGTIYPNVRVRVGVKMASGESGHAAAHFNKAFPHAVKAADFSLPGQPISDSLGHLFALTVGEYPDFRQGFT